MKKILGFVDTIDGSVVEDLLVELRSGDPPNCIYVSSPGGRFEFFSVLGPAIQRQGITTIAGDVCSAAVILYLLGHARFAFQSSTFFFHEVRTLVGPSCEVTVCDLEEVLEYQKEMEGEGRELYQEWLRRMNATQDWFLSFLSRTTGLSRGTFLNLMRSEATLNAYEARRYGIVHEVLSQDQEHELCLVHELRKRF